MSFVAPSTTTSQVTILESSSSAGVSASPKEKQEVRQRRAHVAVSKKRPRQSAWASLDDNDVETPKPSCSQRHKKTTTTGLQDSTVSVSQEKATATTLQQHPVAAAAVLSISCQPALLQPFNEFSSLETRDLEDCGCIARFQMTKDDVYDSLFTKQDGDDIAASLLALFYQALPNYDMLALAKTWIQQQPVDTPEEIQTALHNFLLHQQQPQQQQQLGQQHSLLGQDDLIWWSSRQHYYHGRPSLRNLCKTRRVCLPMAVILEPTAAANKNNHNKGNNHNQRVMLLRLKESLADLLLQRPETRPLVLDTLLNVATLLQKWAHMSWDGISSSGSGHYSTLSLYMYRRFEKLLYQTLRRAGGTVVWKNVEVDLAQLRPGRLPLVQLGTERKSVPENTRLEHLDIRAKRRELQAQLLEYSNDKASEWRMVDGGILLTEQEDGMSERAFLEEAYFMGRVNSTLARPFIPLISRPCMAQIQLAPTDVGALRSILFDVDGSLHKDMVPDVMTSSKKHHYINFTNSQGAGLQDRRWQIPIKLHGNSSGRVMVPTRRRIEEVLSKARVLRRDCEAIHDLGLLVGGTEDQSVHHDISRQWTFWQQREAASGVDEQPFSRLLGWEENRLAYNRAMASRYAPCSMLIGMGSSPNDLIHVGVQKDQVERIAKSDRCRIIRGAEHDTFKIVRESHHLVVLEAKTGVVFTGDFPHAGVRNVALDSPEEKLLKDLYRKIDKILERSTLEESDSRFEANRAILDMLCEFKGLDRLCRLHCSTEMLNQKMIIPRNTVGYTGCFSNPPDGSEAYDD